MWVFFSLILARRWRVILAVIASALADLAWLRTGLSRLRALFAGSAIGRFTCFRCA